MSIYFIPNLLTMKTKVLAAFAVALFLLSSCNEDGVDGGSDTPDIVLEGGVATGSFAVYEDGGDQTVTIEFDHKLDRYVQVAVTVSGTAVYGTDYSTNLGIASDSYVLQMSPETKSASFTFSPINNDDEDGERTVELTVSVDDKRVEISDASITVTIKDDESIAKNFLLNSTKVTTADLWLNCNSPMEITYSGNMAATVFPGGEFAPTMDVSYSRDTVLLAFSDIPFGVSGEEPPTYYERILVDEENIRGRVQYVDEGFSANQLREVIAEGPPFYAIVESYDYDDNGRIASITVTYYQEDGGIYDQFTVLSFAYNSNGTEVTITEEEGGGPRVVKGIDGDGPSQNVLTLDGKSNPFNGLAGIGLMFAGGQRFFYHALLPSNLVSGYYSNNGPVEYNYTYNSQGYPTGSATTKGEIPGGSKGVNFETWNNTIQYSDMDGLDPDGNAQNCD